MLSSPYLPIFELTRGNTVESVHSGAVAVVDASGKVLASYGDPQAVTFLRSSAKPYQALPLIECGGHTHYGLTGREIALMCASHNGTDEHVQVARQMQGKTGVSEDDLLCGVHPLSHFPTLEAMRQRGETLTPNRNNCSGKHTGMLAYARMKELPTQDYINPAHPIQQDIINSFAFMCDIPVDQVRVGIDGCSAPNFAVPLYHAALGLARLVDPETGKVGPAARQAACRVITQAMIEHPDMVGGPISFDTALMQAAERRILSKHGADGYISFGLLPGVFSPGSPGVGVVAKVADGDVSGRARPAVTLEILRQLRALDTAAQAKLQRYGPVYPVRNLRDLEVGQARPCFELHWY